MNKRLPVLLILVYCTNCSTPPPLNPADSAALLAPLISTDSVCALKGYGDVYLSSSGQRGKAKFDARWNGDSDCAIDLYTPFGGSLASMRSDSTGDWTITQGGVSIKRLPSDPVALLPGAQPYPFSYAQFVSIVFGRLPSRRVLAQKPDTVLIEEKQAAIVWRSAGAQERPYSITAHLNRKHSTVSDVFYADTTVNPWTLSFSSFTDGNAKEIRFNDNHSNYFYVKYERMISQKKAPSRRRGN